jgi:sensory rhodopsin
MTNLLYIIDNHAGGMGLEEFTFFIGTMALMGASAFFFLSLSQFDKKWRNSILVSGLITFIAAVHYFYMRGELGPDGSAGDITSIRYIDWILTVPLMCVEFYLLLKVAGATTKHLRDLIVLSLIMLITGYVGEAGMGNAALWGLFSGLAYFAIVYMIKYGELAKLAKSAGGSVEKAHNTLFWFVFVGWAIYPLGYMIGTAEGSWYAFMGDVGLDMNVVYNIGDAINKIGFGLVVYAAAVKETK